MHDFYDKEKGKAVPYGIYDLLHNKCFVNVGISSDTAQFAVNSIRVWWNEMGRQRFSNAKQLTVTADSSGSNSYRTKLWKIELQKLADELGLDIIVHHFPPGTDKWNIVCFRTLARIGVVVRWSIWQRW